VRTFTLLDLLDEMNIEPHNELTWTLGAALRERFRELHDRLPEKELRTKRSGLGSHCFAVYPISFKPEAQKIVTAHETESKKQQGWDF